MSEDGGVGVGGEDTVQVQRVLSKRLSIRGKQGRPTMRLFGFVPRNIDAYRPVPSLVFAQ